MQKLIIPFFLVSFCLAACAPTKEDYRKDFVKGCVNSYAKDSSVANEKGRAYVEEYCNCVGDQMNAQMSAEQWREFNKSGDTALSRFRDVIAPCKETFIKKVEALKH